VWGPIFPPQLSKAWGKREIVALQEQGRWRQLWEMSPALDLALSQRTIY
jgi:hypothetical protein